MQHIPDAENHLNQIIISAGSKKFYFKSQILWVYDFFVILAWYPNSKNALFDLIRRRGRAEAVARDKRTERHEGGDLVQGSFESFEIDSTQVAQVQ